MRNTIKVTIELTRDMTIEDALDEIAASTAGTVWLVAEGERDGRRSCVPTLYTREATAFFGIDLLQ